MPSNFFSSSTLSEVLVADRLQVAAKAGVADQRLVAFRELALQRGQDRGPIGGILLRLLMIAADDVAPASQRHRLGGIVNLLAALADDQRDEWCGIRSSPSMPAMR
jgi:hypothetical protein